MHEEEPRARDTLIWSDNGCEHLIPASNSRKVWRRCGGLCGPPRRHRVCRRPSATHCQSCPAGRCGGQLNILCSLSVLLIACPLYLLSIPFAKVQVKSIHNLPPLISRKCDDVFTAGFFMIINAQVVKVCISLGSPLVNVVFWLLSGRRKCTLFWRTKSTCSFPWAQK